jgi:TPR repeat protein
MPETEQDFDLQILKERDGGGRYRINVIQSPAGEAGGEFDLPFSESEIKELFRGLGNARKTTRGAASLEVANAREFGTKLFDRVFSGDVRDCLNSSRGRTQAAGHGLRIRLRLTKVPELLDLPWELFFDRRYNRFVALDDGMTLVRHLPVAEPVIPMRVEAPLRVLVAISNPRGDLDTELEWTKLSDALASLSERGLVEVERLQPATFDGLEAKLRKDTFHVLHFVGHGEYDAATQSGFLGFELEPKGEKRVGAMRLADLLRPFRTLRLVVLNACEGGRTSREDAFAGVAQSLVQSAIPAVVAMQFPVTDAAAIVFAGAFYSGIAAGRPVDLALADARREVNLKGEEGDIEWATPVLYMRGSGALFDVSAGAGPMPAKQLVTPPQTPMPELAVQWLRHKRVWRWIAAVMAVAAVAAFLFWVLQPEERVTTPASIATPASEPPAVATESSPATRSAKSDADKLEAARRALDAITARDWGVLPAVPLISTVTRVVPFDAIRYLADQGHARAQVLLAYATEAGLNGVGRDPQRATALHRQAASRGDPTAQNELALRYALAKDGVTKDEREALRLLRLSAAQGNAWGQANLGVFLLNGMGGAEKNEREAVRLFRLAAEQGNRNGQANLADMLETGSGGLKQDRAEAARLYQAAADQDNARAQSSLGVYYRDALGGLVQNDAEAVRLFRLSVAQEEPSAYGNLGHMVERGLGGLKKNPEEALRLYREGARRGNEWSQQLLKSRNETW